MKEDFTGEVQVYEILMRRNFIPELPDPQLDLILYTRRVVPIMTPRLAGVAT
jgi:hypothetical protein